MADATISAAKLDTATNNYLAAAQTSVQSVNGKTGTAVSLAAADVSAIPTSQIGANSGVAPLDSGGLLPANRLPSTAIVKTGVAGDVGKAIDASTGQPLVVGSAGPSLLPTASKTSAYTAAAGDAVRVDASTAAVTITLPASAAAGTVVSVKKSDSTMNLVSVIPSGSDTIDGLTTVGFKDRNTARTFRKDSSTTWVVTDGLTTTSGPGNARYDRLKNVYLPSDDCLLPYKQAIARARNGGAPARVEIRGDSTTLGTLSGTNPNSIARRDLTYTSRARQLLGNTLLPGLVEESITDLNVANDSRLTYSGGSAGAVTSGQTLTFAEAAGGHDAFDLVILRGGGAPSVSVSVDSGAAQVLTLSQTNNTVAQFRVTGTGTSAHTVVITGPASGTATVLAIEPVLTTSPPIMKLGGYGVSGQKLSTLNPSVTTVGTNMFLVLQAKPDLQFLHMGINDMRFSYPQATSSLARGR